MKGRELNIQLLKRYQSFYNPARNDEMKCLDCWFFTLPPASFLISLSIGRK